MIVYVVTNEDMAKKISIIKEMAEKIGINSATNLVDYWFDNYDNFIYSKETGGILVSKSRVHGEWIVDKENLQDFRI